MEIGIQLGGPDTVSIKLIETWPGLLFIGPGLNHSDLELHSYLLETHFRNGSTPTSDAIARYYVQRVRSYAHVETMAIGHIRHAVVQGECHEGHFVNVADAASWLKWFKSLSPLHYEKRVFGRDYGFPPYDMACQCQMEALIEGAENYHRLNSDRKLWKWFKGSKKTKKLVK